MTPRERLLARLRHEPVDRVPNLSILMLFAARYIAVPYDQYCQDYRLLVNGNLRCAEAFGIDAVTVMSDAYTEAADYGATVSFPYDSLPACEGRFIEEPSDLDKLARFNPAEGPRMSNRLRAVELYRQEAGDVYPIIGWVEGPIAELADLHGLTETLMDLTDEPAFIEDAFSLLVEQAVVCARAQIDAGADIIGIGDAAASLVSPNAYRTQVLPYEQRLVQGIHDAGGQVKLHICGDISHLLGDVWQTGADIIDVDWMVDLGEAAARWPHETVINGNFDPVAVMLQGTPNGVRAATRLCMAQGGDRLCVSPGCEVPKDTPHENLLALHDELCSQAMS